jgi:hypothetical protein
MGDEQIIRRGHRNYVGAKWEVLGALQLDFLKSRGLNPHHVLYDIGCGSLRAGVFFIPYLEKGNYCGIDREKTLIELGISQEIGETLYQENKPEFVISKDFNFHEFSKKPDYAIAQSLFTHLTLKDIRKCLSKLREVKSDGCQFYATFDQEGVTPMSNHRKGLPNPPWSHSNLTFYYTKDQMKKCGDKTGWKFKYIGDWLHPSKQQMVLYY